MFFAYPRIKNGFHPGVVNVLRPAHEMIHGPLRAVSVEYLKRQAEMAKIVPDLFKGFSRFFGHKGLFGVIAVYSFPDEIFSRVVAQVDLDVGDYLLQIYELLRHDLL